MFVCLPVLSPGFINECQLVKDHCSVKRVIVSLNVRDSLSYVYVFIFEYSTLFNFGGNLIIWLASLLCLYFTGCDISYKVFFIHIFRGKTNYAVVCSEVLDFKKRYLCSNINYWVKDSLPQITYNFFLINLFDFEEHFTNGIQHRICYGDVLLLATTI